MGTDPRAEAVAAALVLLRARLNVLEHEPGPDSHALITVEGLEEADCAAALGVYLTGLVASIVGIDLVLADRLLGAGADAEEQLQRDVQALIGASNELEDDFRENLRNPWIAEGIAHLVLALPDREPGPCVPGVIHAVTLPHDKSTQQGLDTVAMYDEDELLLAVCIGEAKASEVSPADHLGRSISLFGTIDQGSRDHQIRSSVNLLSGYLPEHVRERIVPSFWRNRRLYLPVVAYRSDCGFRPAQSRPQTFGRLLVPPNRRRLVALPLEDFHDFFDTIADEMRAAVAL